LAPSSTLFPYTTLFRSPYAESFVLYALSSHSGGIVDSKLVMENEVDGDMGNAWLKQANSAGSGPFVLNTWTPKQSILLTRNENRSEEHTSELQSRENLV